MSERPDQTLLYRELARDTSTCLFVSFEKENSIELFDRVFSLK